MSAPYQTAVINGVLYYMTPDGRYSRTPPWQQTPAAGTWQAQQPQMPQQPREAWNPQQPTDNPGIDWSGQARRPSGPVPIPVPGAAYQNYGQQVFGTPPPAPSGPRDFWSTSQPANPAKPTINPVPPIPIPPVYPQVPQNPPPNPSKPRINPVPPIPIPPVKPQIPQPRAGTARPQIVRSPSPYYGQGPERWGK